MSMEAQTKEMEAKSSEKVASIESNQTKILGILSSLKDGNVAMQERLETLENNITPKFHDGAARNMITPNFHDGAASRN